MRWRLGHDVDADVEGAMEARRELFAPSVERGEEAEAIRFSGDRLRRLRHALELVAAKIAGEYTGPEIDYVPRETRWASIGHALSRLVIARVDGASLGASVAARLEERIAYGTDIQWTRRASIPPAVRLAEDLLLMRVTGRQSPIQIAGHLSRTLYGWEPEEEAAEPTPIRPRLAARVTRWGARRVYEHLRERRLIPARGT